MKAPPNLLIQVDATPDSILSPNSGKHERTQRPYRKQLKEAGAVGVQNVLRGQTWEWPGPIVLNVEIHWERDRNVMDWDNCIPTLKGVIDGIFGKLKANDRQVAGIFMRQHRTRASQGFMVVRVRAVRDQELGW